VFVHPAAGSSQGWSHQLPAFAAAGWRCVTYDLRGWGRSASLDNNDTGTAAMSDDLAALVEHLQLQRFCLVAAAYGGFGALDYALRFPSRLRGLVLATTQAGLADPTYTVVLRRAVTPEIRALPVELRELGPSYRAEDPAGVARWLEMVHAARGEVAPRQPLVLEISLAMLEELRVPTLLLAGGADLLAPPALMRLLQARIPQGAFAVIAEAGHSAHWERPEEWNRLVLAFLEPHRGPQHVRSAGASPER
jgi:pimeloyl-ACP methyl ester carboxylesterase